METVEEKQPGVELIGRYGLDVLGATGTFDGINGSF
jgi:hypothetical protein